MTPTVLLFDIDGTLVATGGAGRRAMVGAFVELYGKEDVFEGMAFGGMTDRAIARHGITAALGACEEREIDRALDVYVGRLERELAAATGYRILPGVVELVAAVSGRQGVAVGLGTGNVRRGAQAKLARGALHESFAFGGFGCDAEDRFEIVRAGARRGAEALGAPVDACRVVVIGDTPKDVAAARGAGAECVAVGTGGFAVEGLLESGADAAFATLAADGVLAALLDR